MVVVALPGVAGMSAIDLDMAPKILRLKASGFDLDLSLAQQVDIGGVRAKWSKKKSALTIRAPII